MIVTHHQLRAARSLLDMDQKDVAAGVNIAANSIGRIERGEVQAQEKTKQKLVDFFEMSGVEFTECDGVRKRRSYIKRYSGQEGIRAFFDTVYDVAKNGGGDFTIFNGMPSDLTKHAGEDWYKAHAARMTSVKDNYNFRVIVEHGETNLIGRDFVTYKWFPNDEFHPCTIYTFGDWVGFLTFDNEVNIVVVREKIMAESQRALFNRVWEYAKDIPENVHQL